MPAFTIRSAGLLLVVAAVVACALAGCRSTQSIRRQTTERFEVHDAAGRVVKRYTYLLYRPPGHEEPTRRWPLLLYLPGTLSFGHDVRKLIDDDPPEVVERGRPLPMVVMTPMTPTWLEPWTPELTLSMIDYAIRTYRVDPTRVYVSGVSLGAVGAWELAKAHPHRVAAIVPVGAWGSTAGIGQMSRVAVWAFHGALDVAVPFPRHKRLVDAHRRAGGTARFTLLPGGHAIWSQVYARDDLYAWLLRQSTAPSWTTSSAPAVRAR